MKRSVKIKLSVAAFMVRAIYFLTRILGLGEGTNFPGRIIALLFPDILSHFLTRFRRGWILITGTNGKTTTTKILVELMRQQGITVVTNARGANLIPGILTSLLLGKLALTEATMADYAVFEIDEAVLIKSFHLFKPQILVVTNFSRDQLDRYGEVDSNVNRIMELLQKTDPPCRVVLNGNDPNVTRIGAALNSANCLYFGIMEDITAADTGLLIEKEIGQGLECETGPVPLDVRAEEIRTEYLKGSHFVLHYGPASVAIASRLPGVYNILNILAAVAVYVLLPGSNLSGIQDVLNRVEPCYGRSELFTCQDKPVYLFLVKNPVGFNHILQLLAKAGGPKRILLLLNDLAADGTDVSWIWDVSLENLWAVPEIREIVTSGTRAGDMALRVKYSNPPSSLSLSTDYQPRRALRNLLDRLAEEEAILVLANYTAMIQFRPFLVKLCRKRNRVRDGG